MKSSTPCYSARVVKTLQDTGLWRWATHAVGLRRLEERRGLSAPQREVMEPSLSRAVSAGEGKSPGLGFRRPSAKSALPEASGESLSLEADSSPLT